jgi:20S proteasome subunit beta 4
MECLIGMQFEDFVMVAADQTNARSIMVMKSDQNKFVNLSDRSGNQSCPSLSFPPPL